MAASRTSLISALALAGTALAALPAHGQQSAPVGCAGLAFTDKAGDQVFAVPGLGGTGTGNANTDVINGWFTSTEDGYFAHIQVSELTKAVDSPSNGTTWYMVWDLAGATKFVSASSDGAAVTYAYGTQDAGFTEEGSTSGTFKEGKNGIISIKIPAAVGGTEGKKLGSPYAHVANAYQVPGAVGALGTADDAPDSQKGVDYVVGSCQDGAAPPPAPPLNPNTPAAAEKLGITVSGSVSAAKANKAKAVTLTLKSSAERTGVSLSLAKGKKVVATGSLAKLSGTAKAKLKTKGKLSAGSYKLTVKATGAGGAKLSGTFTVKVKK